MTDYYLDQEMNDLRWGTGMPVSVMVGSEYAEIRARGLCSLIVKDAQRLQEQVPNPEDLNSALRSLMAMAITNLIGERSRQVSGAAELTRVTGETVQALQSALEPQLAEMGLEIKDLKIEAIEKI